MAFRFCALRRRRNAGRDCPILINDRRRSDKNPAETGHRRYRRAHQRPNHVAGYINDQFGSQKYVHWPI